MTDAHLPAFAYSARGRFFPRRHARGAPNREPLVRGTASVACAARHSKTPWVVEAGAVMKFVGLPRRVSQRRHGHLQAAIGVGEPRRRRAAHCGCAVSNEDRVVGRRDRAGRSGRWWRRSVSGHPLDGGEVDVSVQQVPAAVLVGGPVAVAMFGLIAAAKQPSPAAEIGEWAAARGRPGLVLGPGLLSASPAAKVGQPIGPPGAGSAPLGLPGSERGDARRPCAAHGAALHGFYAVTGCCSA